MGIINRQGALYMATGIDNSHMYVDKQEAMGIIKAMAKEITSFDIFSGIGISAATAFAKAAKNSYDFEKEFKSNMSEVSTISEEITNNMAGYMNQVIELTKDIPVSAPEAAKALYQIVSAGHDGAEGMKILEVSAKSAIAGITDTTTAADAITTIINAYKMSADKAALVSDQLFTTAKLGKTTFGELGQSIAQAAPIAAAYGVEIDQVLAAIASLTKQGTPTAQAMTQIRSAIIGVSKVLGDGAFNGRTFQEALQLVATKANGSESKLRELVPDVEAVNGVLGMTGINAKMAASDLSELQKSSGATENAFKKMQEETDNQLKLLSNNIHAALRPMGQAILKEVSDLAKSFNEAFDNGDVESALQQIGNMAKFATEAFISYKTIVVLATVAQNMHTRSIALNRLAAIKHITTTELLTQALRRQAVAMLSAGKAALTNPYVLAAVAITALGYGIYKVITATNGAELGLKRYNDRLKEQQKLAEAAKERTDKLLNTVKDETSTNYERNKAMQALKALYPEIFAKYDVEKLKLADIVALKKQIAELDGQRTYQDDKSHYNDLLSQRAQIDKKLAEMANTPTSSSNDYFYVTKLKKERNAIQNEINSMYGSLQDRANAIWNTSPKEVKIISLKSNIKSLEAEQKRLNEIANGNYISKNSSGYNPTNDNSSVNKARINQIKDELQKYYAELNSLQNDSSRKNESVKIALSKKEQDALKKEQNKELKNHNELSQAIIDNDLKLQAARNAAMEDGKAKRIAIARQEAAETIASIQKERQDYLDKAKDDNKKPDKSVLANFSNRETEANNKETLDISLIDKEYAEEYKKRDKELTDVFLNDEQKKLSAIKDRYEQERKWATNQLETGGMTDTEYKSYNNNINIAQAKETSEALLDNINDYKKKEKDLREKWDTDINAAVETKDAYLVAKLQEGKQKALSTLNGQMLQESAEWQQLFGDMDNLTASQIENLISIIRDKSKNLKLNPVDMKAITGSLNEAKDKLIQINPFAQLGKSFKAVFKDTSKDSQKDSTNIKNDWQNLAKSTQGCFSFINDAVNSCGALSDILGESGKQTLSMVENITMAGIGLAEAISTAEKSSIVLAAISATLAVVTAVFSMVDKAHEVSQKTIDQYNALIDVLDKVIDKHKELMQELSGASAVNEYNTSIDLINKQIEATRKLGLEYLDSNAKRSHTYGYKLRQDLQDYQQEFNRIGISWNRVVGTGRMEGLFTLSAEQLKQIQEQLPEAWAHIDEKTRGYLQTIIDCDDKVSDMTDNLSESLNQISFDDMYSSYLDTLLNMDSDSQTLADNLEKYLQKAMLKSILDQKYKDRLKSWYNTFTSANKDGELTTSEIAELRSEWSKISEEVIKERDNLKEVMGWTSDTTDSSSDNTLKGAYAKESQESIGLLAGQTGAQRVAVEYIRDQLQDIRSMQSEGWENVKAIRDLTSKVNDNTTQIARNTNEIKLVADKIENHTLRTAESLESTISVKVKI